MAKSLSPAQKAQKEYQEKKKKQQQTYTPGGAKNYQDTSSNKKSGYDPSTKGLSANQRAQKAYQDKKKTENEIKLRKQVNGMKEQQRGKEKEFYDGVADAAIGAYKGAKTAANVAKGMIDEVTDKYNIDWGKLKNIGKSQPTKASGATKAEAESAAKSQSDQAQKRRTATVLKKTRSSKQNAPKKDTTSREYYKSKTTNAYEIAFGNKKKKSIWE